MKKTVDLDMDFFQKMWCVLDVFDLSTAQKDFELLQKYIKIMTDEPTLFVPPQNQELSRDEARLLAYR